jgi:hypothetical protein
MKESVSTKSVFSAPASCESRDEFLMNSDGVVGLNIAYSLNILNGHGRHFGKLCR